MIKSGARASFEVDLARRVRVEIRQGGLEENPARTGHRVAVVDRL
jgi:hypothetical protein